MTADDEILTLVPERDDGAHLAPLLPRSLRLELLGNVAILTLSRVHKRNALNDETVMGIGRFFASPPPGIKVVLLVADGDNFSAGLDLGEVRNTDAVAGLDHSRMWHEAFAHIESGHIPVIAVLKGAVIGGGLELAAAAHLRIAEDSAFFALPEGMRGLFVGGGASVRIPRLIGVQRMTDLMLTGRVLTADEASEAGLAHYRVADGEGLAKALELSRKIAENSSVTNFAVLQVLPRIADADHATGLLLEALMAAVAQSSAEAKSRIDDFLAHRAKKVPHGGEDR
jgi:enoyl-CoA hydratase/carnithine racemase